MNFHAGSLPLSQDNVVASLAEGSAAVADWSARLGPTVLAEDLPGLGHSLGRALASEPKEEEVRGADPDSEAGAEVEGPGTEQGSSLLRRLVESGVGAFELEDIGRELDQAALTQGFEACLSDGRG